MDRYSRITVATTETRDAIQHKTEGGSGELAFRVITQNVQGFSVGSRLAWLQSWRNLPVQARPVCILIQEMHITSRKEAADLTTQWERMWNHTDVTHRLALWSVALKKTGGVGILLTPRRGWTLRPWRISGWTERIIAVEINDWKCVNIYAPSASEKERAHFYKGIETWNLQQHPNVILGGDFNCVESPPLDRTGPMRRRTTECPELTRLLLRWKMQDAALVQFPAWQDEDRENVLDYTFWRGESASRIDRFYISEGKFEWVNRVSTSRPGVPSDHDQVEILVRQPRSKQQRPRNHHFRLQYPIRGAGGVRVQEENMELIGTCDVIDSAGAARWDSVKDSWVEAIIRVRSRVAQRSRRHAKHLEHALYGRVTSRDQILKITENEVTRCNQVRIARRFCRSNENLRWLYQRTATWERDQRVEEIILQDQTYTHAPDMSIPDKFVWTWQQILGAVHRKVQGKEVTQQIQALVEDWSHRQVSSVENESLLAPIQAEDIQLAIKRLERRKDGGSDGLNNDFFKDFVEELMPDLLQVYNDVLNGAPPPESFLEAVIIPLKKKGESTNAMDYRPISLLQTSYKIFAKILASRLQAFLGRLVGDSQQGFVHGRRMDRAVVMMMHILQQQQPDQDQPKSSDYGGILLVDFAKAYDTVDRYYLMSTLRSFERSERFIVLMKALHQGTSARFLVNGQLSKSFPVISGIRQGCPLAPLLFILAEEPLGMAIEQHQGLQGVTIRGDNSHRAHTFSAFVDDSMIFFTKEDQVEEALTILERFGKLSGLTMQPVKSHILPLGQASSRLEKLGIPLIQENDTVRYLGYQVGKQNMAEANWAERIRAVQRRLLTATKCGTSVMERVTLFNSIALPAILFTAKVFEPDQQTYKDLIHIQKKFIWSNKTTCEPGRHKMSPHLLFIPRHAGGLGLISIPVAIHTLVKEATMWLLEPNDRYTQAWRNWCHLVKPDNTNVWVSPCRTTGRRKTKRRGQKLSPLLFHLSRSLGPSHDELSLIERYVTVNSAVLQGKCVTQPVISKEILHRGEQVLVQADVDDIDWHEHGRQSLKAFWGTFVWCNNPWIRDENADVLAPSKFAKLPEYTIKDLHIRRVGRATNQWTVQGTEETSHSRRKVGRWLLSIILCSPRVEIGEEIGEAGRPKLLNTHDQWKSVAWKFEKAREVTGTCSSTGQMWSLRQRDDGIYWDEPEGKSRIRRNNKEDIALSEHQQLKGLVFAAHPRLHNYPWSIKEGVNICSVKGWIRRSFRGYYYQALSSAFLRVRDRWKRRREKSEWNRNVQEQTPSELWKHDYMLSDYQLWSIYRAATFQLNVYYDGYFTQGGCALDDQCKTPGKGVTHIVWGCSRAKQFWARLLTCWNGRSVLNAELEQYRRCVATRKPPEISEALLHCLQIRCEKIAEECKEALARVWKGICSLGITWLWFMRNEIVHKGIQRSAHEQLQLIWTKTMKQLLAVAYFERSRTATRLRGIRMLIGLECLQENYQCQSSDEHSVLLPVPQVDSSSETDVGLDLALRDFIVANR